MGIACNEVLDADTGQGCTEVHGQDLELRRLLGERLAKWAGIDRCPVEVAVQDHVVVAGHYLDRSLGEARIVKTMHRDAGLLRAEAPRRSHRKDVHSEALHDRSEHPPVVSADPIDLVHEHDRRHAEPTQGAKQQQRLRLHALDRRHDQDGAVENSEHAIHLGDEIWVSRRVDEVDHHTVDHERHHRGPDRDPALALQGERVGLRGAVIDATDLVDDSSCVQQPFGESGLTGVYVRQDPQVQHRQLASRPSDRHQVPDR